MTQLSPNFTLDEFVASDTAAMLGIDNNPPPDELACLEILADTMEKVRTLLGDKPITINSGYRCYELNVACGGAENSAHLYGLACDFVCPEFGTPLDICVALEPHMLELGIDQLIWEFEGWCHLAISVPSDQARCECLTINENGTTTGFA